MLTGGEEFPGSEAVQVGDDGPTADKETDHRVRQSVAVQRHYLLKHDQHLAPSWLEDTMRGRGERRRDGKGEEGRGARRGVT